MNETNIIDVTKLNTNASGKSGSSPEPEGTADFASELTASSLMLQFFDFSSKLSPTSDGALNSAARIEDSSGDELFERKIRDRDERFLRDVKMRFEDWQRADKTEKNIISDSEIDKAGKSKSVSVDARADTASEKAAAAAENIKSDSEVSGEEENLKEPKNNQDKVSTQGKLSSGEAKKAGDQKSLKNLPVSLAKGDTAKTIEGAEVKGTVKAVAKSESAVLSGHLEIENLADQLKASVASANEGAVVLPKISASATFTTQSTTAVPSVVTAPNSAQTGGAVKAAPIVRSAGFDSFLVRQVATKMALVFKNDVSTAKLTLNPPELGKLRVEIVVEGTRVKATIATENVLVRDLLESSLSLLKQALTDQGLNVTDLNISLTDGSGSNDKTSGFLPGRRGSGSKGKEQEGPGEQPLALRVMDDDTLDIFI